MSTHNDIHNGIDDSVAHGLTRPAPSEDPEPLPDRSTRRAMNVFNFLLGVVVGFILGMVTIILIDVSADLHRPQVIEPATPALSTTMRI